MDTEHRYFWDLWHMVMSCCDLEELLYIWRHHRRETCAALARDTGKTTIPSSDNIDVICGQGTLALELLEEVYTQCFLELL